MPLKDHESSLSHSAYHFTELPHTEVSNSKQQTIKTHGSLTQGGLRKKERWQKWGEVETL